AQTLPNCTDRAINHSELYDLGLGFRRSWRPVLNSVSGPSGSAVTLFGAFFQGLSEASGHGAQNSASNYPVAQLRSLGNEQVGYILPSTANGGWSSTSFSFQPVANFAPGPALLTIIVNGIPSEALVVNSDGSEVPTGTDFGSIRGRVTYHN